MRNNHFLKKYFKHYSLRFILLLLAFIFSIVIVSYIAHEMIVEGEDRLDREVLRFISSHVIHQQYTTLVKGITFFASVLFLVIASVAVLLLYVYRKDWKRVIEFASVSVGGFLITTVMKIYFQRDRPRRPLIDGAENFSFPSGHALSGIIFYGFVAYLIWKSGLTQRMKYVLSTLLILFSFLIDLSRLYLRVHYPSDVITGVLVGLAWLIGAIWLIERWTKKPGSAAQKV